MQKQLSYRFREDVVRRYERDIATMVDNYPNITQINSGTLSQVTYVCRLRDAKNSFAMHRWPSDFIDYDKFLRIYEDIVIRERPDGTIIGGSREATKLATGQQIATEDHLIEQIIHFDESKLTATELVCLLLTKGVIPRGTRFYISNLPDAHGIRFEQSYDVGIQKQADGTHLIL